jgi:hypothetical protein
MAKVLSAAAGSIFYVAIPIARINSVTASPHAMRLLTALPKEHRDDVAYGASVGTMWCTAQVSSGSTPSSQ